ncbi:MAG TPA: hypothetical protein VF660_07975, partial [Actinomycetota bacterium]
MLENRGGFSLRLVGGTPNLLPNPSFEVDADHDGIPDGWRFAPGAGTAASTDTVAHSGRRSMTVSLPSEAVSASFSSAIAVAPETSYVLSAWFRSRDVQPTIPPAVRETYHQHSPLEVEAVQAVGGATRMSAAHGYTDSAGWHRQFVGFKTGAGVRRVVIRGAINRGSGTGWFDDLYVGRLYRGSSVPLTGSVTRSGGSDRQRAVAGTAGVSLDAVYRRSGDHIQVDGTVSSSKDMGVQLAYTVPVDASGWRWGDDARRTRRIRNGTYEFLSKSSLQQTSVYPFGVVFDRDASVAIGVPLSKPRIFRIEYASGRGLTVTFDLGLSDAFRLGRKASFSFTLFTPDPAWGFRAATAAYYDLFPTSFVRRTDPACEGAWFVAPPLESIDQSYRDFGLGLNMVALGKASSQSYQTWGVPYVRWDDERGIYSTAYGQHWAFYQPIQHEASATPSYDAAITGLRTLASGTARSSAQSRLREEARAALSSTARDINGRLYYERYGRFLAYYEDPEPQRSAMIDWAHAVERYQMGSPIQTARSDGGRLDGFHLDSTSGMRRWGAADDYWRDHWRSATEPLTFSDDSGLVVQRGVFPMYRHIAETADFAHRRGMILSANFNADLTRACGWIGADQIDYFGIEQGLAARARTGTADRFALWKRTLAYQRPVSTLDARIGGGRLSSAEVDAALQQNLFYGIFAGAWNPKTEAGASGEKSPWTDDEFATVWARYTPLFRKLARAGWEPVTYARASDPAVWVERFGGGRPGPVFFTLRNETKAARPYRLAIDLSALNPTGPMPRVAFDELGRRRIALSPDKAPNSAVVSGTLP